MNDSFLQYYAHSVNARRQYRGSGVIIGESFVGHAKRLISFSDGSEINKVKTSGKKSDLFLNWYMLSLYLTLW